MSYAKRLAQWVQENYPYSESDPLTHLKLQKLVFYCYGTALAFRCESEVGGIVTFEPWEHGPVNRDIWTEFRDCKSNPLPTLAGPPVHYPLASAHCMRDALAVYGMLDAWSLRQQSHLEAPWKVAYAAKAHEIPTEDIRRHFAAKLCGGRVSYPEYALDPGTFRLDGIPVPSYKSLHELAESVRRSHRH